jgi:hypothetical protein
MTAHSYLVTQNKDINNLCSSKTGGDASLIDEISPKKCFEVKFPQTIPLINGPFKKAGKITYRSRERIGQKNK